MSSIKILFGKKIKEYRKEKRLTQSKLAEIVHVDSKHISCIESGKNFPSPELIERFAKAFDIEPKDLFEFYYLQDEKNLKYDITKMVDKLSTNNLRLVYNYIRNFIIK